MIEIKYDDREVLATLNRLGRVSQDLTPAMRDIAAALEDVAAESFESEQAPAGTPWPTSPSTPRSAAPRKRNGPARSSRSTAVSPAA